MRRAGKIRRREPPLLLRRHAGQDASSASVALVGLGAPCCRGSDKARPAYFLASLCLSGDQHRGGKRFEQRTIVRGRSILAG